MPLNKRYSDAPLTGPSMGRPVTPHDTEEQGHNGLLFRGYFIGTGGDMVVNFADDDTDIVLRNLPDGCELVYQLRRIKATGTSAADIVGLA